VIPQALSVRVHSGPSRRLRLWVPVVPVVILLAPLLALGLVVMLVGLAILRINPVRGLGAAWSLVAATRGLRLEINTRDLTIHVKVW
jgi:hypothetical protein